MRLLKDWKQWARPEQLPPKGDWRVWLVDAGRGFGKTRTGAEWSREKARTPWSRGAFIGRTAADVRDVMIDGESGILACCYDDEKPHYEPSKRRLTFPNGSQVTCFSAEKPSALRGPQHDWVWAEETAAWKYPDETWDMMQMGLRLGKNPQVCVTTTPRPIPLIKKLLKTAVVTTGTTFDNIANLPQPFIDELMGSYSGTRIGEQELYAKLLEDTPGALWTLAMFGWFGFRFEDTPELREIVIAVDPATTSKPTSNETGIIVAGVRGVGPKAEGFVLDDISGKMTPGEWGRAVVAAYRYWKANKIVVEVNQGGDLVVANIKSIDPHIRVDSVHQFRGKDVRAEPVAALYEQRRIRHRGQFPQLEDQLHTWSPLSGEDSPDRLDALVIALTDLMLGATSGFSGSHGGFSSPGSETRL